MYRSYSVVGGESGRPVVCRAGEAKTDEDAKKKSYPFAPWGDAVIYSLPFAFESSISNL
jgi:hypothetical protein